MGVSRQHRDKMRARYAHLYDPRALAKMFTKPREKPAPARESLPRGATLPKEPEPAVVWIHSADRPPRKQLRSADSENWRDRCDTKTRSRSND